MFTSIAFIEPTLSWSMTDLDFASLRPGCLRELFGFCSITIVNTAPGKTILHKACVVLTHDAYARPREADREVLLAHKHRLHTGQRTMPCLWTDREQGNRSLFQIILLCSVAVCLSSVALAICRSFVRVSGNRADAPAALLRVVEAYQDRRRH